MSNGSEDKKAKLGSLDEDVFVPRSSAGRMDPLAKKIRRAHPLGMRVLVKIRPDSNVSDGGLYLPEGAKSSTAESVIAEVIEVAVASDDHSQEETNVSGIPLGALVLIPKDAGVKVPWSEKIRIVDSKDVLATVTEVSLS